MDQYAAAKVSYRWLRRTIGGMGAALPFLVWGVHSAQSGNYAPLPTISDYFHSDVQYLFVVILSGIAVLLFAYPGYDQDDDLAGTIAGVCAAGVVLCPTDSSGQGPRWVRVLSALHLTFATGMFITLAVFCLVLFCRTPADRKAVPVSGVVERTQSMLSRVPVPVAGPKKQRNGVYRACGAIILFCIVAIAGFALAGGDRTALAVARPVFILETVALVAFGFAWMVKGEALLPETPNLLEAPVTSTPPLV